MTEWKWSVDGIRIPVTPSKPKKRRVSQSGLSDCVADVRRAIASEVAAVEDISCPDLSRFGVALSSEQETLVVAYRVRVRDAWRARVEQMEAVA